MFRDKIKSNFALFGACLAGCIALLYITDGDCFIAFPAAYLTVYLGTFNPHRNDLLFSGDYSYGIYLYGFPIQQAATALTGPHRSWYLDLCFVLPSVFAVAALSWWFIEKPALKLRVLLPVIETSIIKRIKPSAAPKPSSAAALARGRSTMDQDRA